MFICDKIPSYPNNATFFRFINPSPHSVPGKTDYISKPQKQG